MRIDDSESDDWFELVSYFDWTMALTARSRGEPGAMTHRGTPPVATLAARSCPVATPRTPYVYDPVPQRDERFTDPWNQGVNAEAFLYNEAYPARAKALMMLYKRLREIDVPEMMASIITQTHRQAVGLLPRHVAGSSGTRPGTP